MPVLSERRVPVDSSCIDIDTLTNLPGKTTGSMPLPASLRTVVCTKAIYGASARIDRTASKLFVIEYSVSRNEHQRYSRCNSAAEEKPLSTTLWPQLHPTQNQKHGRPSAPRQLVPSYSPEVISLQTRPHKPHRALKLTRKELRLQGIHSHSWQRASKSLQSKSLGHFFPLTAVHSSFPMPFLEHVTSHVARAALADETPETRQSC